MHIFKSYQLNFVSENISILLRKFDAICILVQAGASFEGAAPLKDKEKKERKKEK